MKKGSVRARVDLPMELWKATQIRGIEERSDLQAIVIKALELYLERGAPMNARRGMGRIFQRKGSSAWWISYYHNGKEYRESSRSSDPRVAEELLKTRLQQVAADQLGFKAFVGPSQDRITVHKVLDDLVLDYEVRGKKTPDFLSHLKRIRSAFGEMKAVHVTESVIHRIISGWIQEGRSAGTTNREMQLLGQAFRLAVERKRLSSSPRIRRLPGDKKRTGFFERHEFEAMVKKLPPYLQDFARFGFLTGWRKGEIASLLWADVDLQAKIIRLQGENSKNGEPRKVALEGDLWEIISRRLAEKETLTPTGVASHRWVFHRKGLPNRNFQKAWASACKAAGVEGKLFHDLRRTAIRNMVRSGVPESVAMRISGHKTRSVFLRYDITSEEDLKQAACRANSYVNSLPIKKK